MIYLDRIAWSVKKRLREKSKVRILATCVAQDRDKRTVMKLISSL